MRFLLKAITPDGRVEALELEAPDRGGALEQAESRGYTVLAVRARFGLSLRLRSAAFPVALFSQELLVLLQAGLSLVDSVHVLLQKERDPRVRVALGRILAALREGRPFSTALEEVPQALPALYVATVRAAERTSDLAAALGRYVAYEQQLDAIRKRIVNASIYPLLLVGVGGLVTLFLLFFVVPRFARVYEERSADLPLFSKLLLGWGQLVEGQGVALLAVLGCAAAAAAWALRMPDSKRRIGETLWRFSAIGERMKVYQLARFYRTVGMLLRGGTPLVTALDMARELLHPALQPSLARARAAVAEGKPVAASLDAHGLTTPVALRMLTVGEQGGSMGEMMDRAAAFHDEEIARWVDWFTRLFEPLLMALIGLVIGAIVVLMYMPIFELAGNLQ